MRPAQLTMRSVPRPHSSTGATGSVSSAPSRSSVSGTGGGGGGGAAPPPPAASSASGGCCRAQCAASAASTSRKEMTGVPPTDSSRSPSRSAAAAGESGTVRRTHSTVRRSPPTRSSTATQLGGSPMPPRALDSGTVRSSAPSTGTRGARPARSGATTSPSSAAGSPRLISRASPPAAV